MFLAGATVMVLLLVAYTGFAGPCQPLGREEMIRVKRLSERLRREETWPYD